MRFVTPRLILVALILSLGCSSVQTLGSYYPGYAFEELRDFELRDGINNPWRFSSGSGPADSGLVGIAVNQVVSEKGYVVLLHHDPEFLVYIHVNIDDVIRISDWGYTYAPDWMPTNKIFAGTFFTANNIVIDIVDAKTSHLIWRAAIAEIGDDIRDAESLDDAVEQAVRAVFAGFPPNKANE